MSGVLGPETTWIMIAIIAGWVVLGSLKTIGIEYYNAILWHNLKVEVHNLRIEQTNRLNQLGSDAQDETRSALLDVGAELEGREDEEPEPDEEPQLDEKVANAA